MKNKFKLFFCLILIFCISLIPINVKADTGGGSGSYGHNAQAHLVIMLDSGTVATILIQMAELEIKAVIIGATEIIATFEDKHRESANFFCPSEFFKEYFRLIKKMVPNTEYVPAVFLTEDDYEEE